MIFQIKSSQSTRGTIERVSRVVTVSYANEELSREFGIKNKIKNGILFLQEKTSLSFVEKREMKEKRL
jgi:hypothetical protein